MPFWRFSYYLHNEVRDLTASLLTEVCHNVSTEPCLQPITSETFPLASNNTRDDARLDVKARGFWSRGQDAFFDVRVFYPNAPSTAPLASLLHINVMKMLRSVNMVTELGMWNMVFLLH